MYWALTWQALCYKIYILHLILIICPWVKPYYNPHFISEKTEAHVSWSQTLRVRARIWTRRVWHRRPRLRCCTTGPGPCSVVLHKALGGEVWTPTVLQPNFLIWPEGCLFWRRLSTAWATSVRQMPPTCHMHSWCSSWQWCPLGPRSAKRTWGRSSGGCYSRPSWRHSCSLRWSHPWKWNSERHDLEHQSPGGHCCQSLALITAGNDCISHAQ